MTTRTNCNRLKVATDLYEFIQNEALPVTGLDADKFWAGFDELVHDLAPKNLKLLEERTRIQKALDDWYKQNPGPIKDQKAYQDFLHEIGYLVDIPENVSIDTSNIDVEVSQQAGPQLVVPITNARYALNAANARWGSLYDALYGTDAISEDDGATRAGGYNPVRGQKVIAYARDFLDNAVPLAEGSHADATRYAIADGQLQVTLENGNTSKLKDQSAFLGYRGDADKPSAIVLKNNGLHIEIQIDPTDNIGKDDKAGVKDVVLEAAVTTIMDLEDSIAAVDSEDKVLAYRNWLGLTVGDLTEEVTKGDKTFTRRLNEDRDYIDGQGQAQTVHGRSVMLVRNVGHLMT